ncbi:MAG: barstar family protein [Treponema sp.]|nr:barstar family protein [Treponema sp.]
MNKREKTLIYNLNAEKMKTKDECMEQFASVFGFDESFGFNWDALHDSLKDIDVKDFEELKIIIDNSNEILAESDKQDFDNLISILNDIKKFYSNDFDVDKPWGHRKKIIEILYR